MGAMMSLLAATLGPISGAATGLVDSGGLGVALPCASVKRSRLLPGVFGECSFTGFKLSPLDREILGEANETAFAINVMETGGIGSFESCDKVGTPSCPQDWQSLYFVVSTLLFLDIRPPSVDESGEAALRRLLARRGHWRLSVDF